MDSTIAKLAEQVLTLLNQAVAIQAADAKCEEAQRECDPPEAC